MRSLKLGFLVFSFVACSAVGEIENDTSTRAQIHPFQNDIIKIDFDFDAGKAQRKALDCTYTHVDSRGSESIFHPKCRVVSGSTSHCSQPKIEIDFKACGMFKKPRKFNNRYYIQPVCEPNDRASVAELLRSAAAFRVMESFGTTMPQAILTRIQWNNQKLADGAPYYQFALIIEDIADLAKRENMELIRTASAGTLEDINNQLKLEALIVLNVLLLDFDHSELSRDSGLLNTALLRDTTKRPRKLLPIFFDMEWNSEPSPLVNFDDIFPSRLRAQLQAELTLLGEQRAALMHFLRYPQSSLKAGCEKDNSCDNDLFDAAANIAVKSSTIMNLLESRSMLSPYDGYFDSNVQPDEDALFLDTHDASTRAAIESLKLGLHTLPSKETLKIATTTRKVTTFSAPAGGMFTRGKELRKGTALLPISNDAGVIVEQNRIHTYIPGYSGPMWVSSDSVYLPKDFYTIRVK